MKNKYKLMAGAVAVLVGISASVQATTINGGISFAGGFSSGNLDTATSITFTPGTDFVTTANGSFAGISPGTLVTLFSPLNINPTTPPVTALWSVGGFQFNDVTLVESGKDSPGVPAGTTLTLTGLGNIVGPGGSTAVAQYIATFNTLNNTFSFSASSGTVPDGGSTVMLLGAAMSGFALLRKKLMA
jgi:hypothetical protein